jgi:hypothetical protein
LVYERVPNQGRNRQHQYCIIFNVEILCEVCRTFVRWVYFLQTVFLIFDGKKN